MARGENILTDGKAGLVTRAMPANQLAQLGGAIQDLQEELGMESSDFSTLLHVPYEIDADASSGIDVIESMPFGVELINVIVQARATSAGGWAVIRNGTDPITNQITMDTDTNIARVGTIDDTYSSFVEGDTLQVITNGAADRGLVTMIFRKV